MTGLDDEGAQFTPGRTSRSNGVPRGAAARAWRARRGAAGGAGALRDEPAPELLRARVVRVDLERPVLALQGLGLRGRACTQGADQRVDADHVDAGHAPLEAWVVLALEVGGP